MGNTEREAFPIVRNDSEGENLIMVIRKTRQGNLTRRELALVAVVGALPVAILGPALLIASQ